MKRTAIYARVSSDRQEKEATIQSQLEVLRDYAASRGCVVSAEYLDDGHSGSVLVRPGLDALRDAVSSGEVDVVLIHSPDRLARKALYQHLVLEEMEQAEVRVEFVNHPVDDSPEGKMMLGMQGLFAEYERAKITERTRRGKLHRAREGALVGGHAPYGYSWVKRSDQGRARLEIYEPQAAVVREMYRWLVEEKLSTRAIARRLTEAGVPTSRGAVQWQPTAVFRIVTNPAYKGQYRYRHSQEEDISIPVPAIVTESTWDSAQHQLELNSQYSRRNNRRNQYLLRGLIRCPRCSGAYTGHSRGGYRGYRCNRAHWASSSTGKRCSPGAIPAQPVEDAVWEAVKEALERPELLVEEYERRLRDTGSADDSELEQRRVGLAQKRIKAREDRVTDAYLKEAMDLARYKSEMGKLRQEHEGLERIRREIERRQVVEEESRGALEHLTRFCDEISTGLDNLAFEEKQRLLRLVVENIAVDNGVARIDTVIPVSPQLGELRYVRGEPVEPRARMRHALVGKATPDLSPGLPSPQRPHPSTSSGRTVFRYGSR